MKPFAKIVGFIAILATVFLGSDHTALVAAIGELPTDVLIAICTIIIGSSHSLNGTGGTASSKSLPATPIHKTLVSNLTTR